MRNHPNTDVRFYVQTDERNLSPVHAFRAIGNLSFFVEPMLNVAYDPGLYKHDVNWRQYVPTFNASAGLVYNFRNKDYKNPFPYKKVYVFAGAGPLFHNNFTNREDVSLFRDLGASANVGFGFYCKEWLGVRTSAQFSNCLWDGDRSHGMRSNTYMAFRLETVFDILPAINLKYTDSRFGVALMLGPETGYMRKLDGDLVINSWYTGATGTISFRYGVAKGLDICLEPRITVLPYSAPTDKPTPQKYWERNYYDGLFGVNLGVIYRFKNR